MDTTGDPFVRNYSTTTDDEFIWNFNNTGGVRPLVNNTFVLVIDLSIINIRLT